jgi:hypothetical protein
MLDRRPISFDEANVRSILNRHVLADVSSAYDSPAKTVDAGLTTPT